MLRLPNSYTGLWTAAARARESARSDALFVDPWAESLAGEAGRHQLEERERDQGPNPYLPVRTRFFDDSIQAANASARQIVLLGTGMDTRAFRLPLAAGSVYYELDRDEVVAYKASILGAAKSRSERRPVPTDLSGDWLTDLGGAGFDSQEPTVWVAEGLLFYLTAIEVKDLVWQTAANSPSGSQFIADVFGTGLLATEAMRPLVEHRQAANIPVPFCSDDSTELFLSNGWTGVQLTAAGEVAGSLGRAIERSQFEGTQLERSQLDVASTRSEAATTLSATFVVAAKN